MNKDTILLSFQLRTSFRTVAVVPILSLLVFCVVPCLASPNNGTATESFFNATPGPVSTRAASESPSFFGWKKRFYQFAPHTGKEDLGQTFTTQSGSDRPVKYIAPVQAGIVPSGRAPSATTPAPQTQSRAPASGQSVSHPFMQREFTEYTNPLLNNWGPPTYGIPFRHTLPHDPNPAGMNPLSFTDAPYLTGATPPSDLVQHALRLAASQRTAEKILDPSLQAVQAAYLGAAQQTADAASMAAAGSFDANMISTSRPLINVANELTATPVQRNQPHRTVAQAIWIVQQMYNRFFLPLAVLLLLVGAVATQTTTFVKYTFTDTSQEQIAHRPLEGILRSVIAVFLIGGIQLTVSYFIDFGNAMTEPVKQAIDSATIASWSQKITNPTKNMSQAQIDARNSSESSAAATMRAVFGSVQALLNTALMVLSVYQLVMVCYLYLLGPIAAAMFAWPEGMGSLFQPVFSSWLNGLSNLVLWRFWWCVILLCMSTRIQWLQDIGSYSPNSPWEPIVYTAFLIMLTYVPFAALDFRPGDMVDSLLEKATNKNGN
jgi:hypothetical protein